MFLDACTHALCYFTQDSNSTQSPKVRTSTLSVPTGLILIFPVKTTVILVLCYQWKVDHHGDAVACARGNDCSFFTVGRFINGSFTIVFRITISCVEDLTTKKVSHHVWIISCSCGHSVPFSRQVVMNMLSHAIAHLVFRLKVDFHGYVVTCACRDSVPIELGI